jgi:putative ABC transport system substrate-binding protein
MSTRREFITLLGGAAAGWPLAAGAQQGERLRRIGVLSNLPENDSQMKVRLLAFLQGLEKRGWSQGRNVQIERRFGATTADQLQAHAEELVALQPDVIVANAPHVVAAAQRAGRQAIPIVFVAVSDPVGAGFVTSLAQPSGNLTGLMNFEASITGKWLAMLKEIAPTLGRAGLVGNPRTTDFDYFLRAMRAVAPSLALEPVPIDVETGTDIEREIELFARKPGGGLVLPPDGTTISHSDLVIALANRHRLPAVYPFRFFVAAGGLMSYATDLADQYRLAAGYVDQILRGAKPTDLPVQAPTRFETVINLGAAKAIGLAVPASLLVRADEVIE